MRKKFHKNFNFSHFLFTALICCFLSTNSFAVDDVAILCRPEVNDPCNEKYVCEYRGGCTCSSPGKQTIYTLYDGSEVCMPAGLTERLADACIAKNFPSKASGVGRTYSLYDYGMEGPYGFISQKVFFGRYGKKLTVKWIHKGNKHENSFSYTENNNEVHVDMFGVINRKTLKNRGVSCLISSEAEIDRVIENFYSGTKRGNKF